MDLFGIGSVVGGLLGYKGQKEANSMNYDLAQQQMNYQTQMSNTSYQRAVDDMQLAGLNPMLAYQQGGASTPSGSVGAPQQNAMGAGLSSAVQAAGAIADVQVKDSQAEVNKATAPRLAAAMRNDNASALATEVQVAQQYPEVLGKLKEQRGLLENERYWSDQQRNFRGNFYKGDSGKRNWEAEFEADLKSRVARGLLDEYDVPGARNRAGSEETAYGRNVRPYLNDLGSITNSASGLANTLRRFFPAPEVRPYRGNSGKRGFSYRSDTSNSGRTPEARAWDRSHGYVDE